ncbi:serine/threonine-protein kinase GE16371 [Drosophila navojoa]|uniref:serine/threonine-protein kinase GE16371 n=1 Tax=Drosophila navojoa TaxID=7232 RepID=UPI000846CC5A|nr:serine/threonine-protein kinase GE16371 [Drosophila navojoa]
MARSASTQSMNGLTSMAPFPVLPRPLSDISVCPLARRLPAKALRVCFLRNMNQHFGGVCLPVSKKRYQEFQALLEAVTVAFRPHVYLKSAITRIFRINGTELLSIDDFFEGDIVACCCQYEPFIDVGYNVNQHYMRILGSLIRMREKIEEEEDEGEDAPLSEDDGVIDYKSCELPQAILLYLDVAKPIWINKSTVIFESTGRARKNKNYIIKMVDREHMCSRTNDTYFEIEILRRLQDHPNIIDLIYTVEQFKYIYIVIERLDCDLFELLQKKQVFPESLVQKAMRDISKGLAYIHACQIIHRDLKLDNLLVQLDYSAPMEPAVVAIKISDFGLATYYQGREIYQCCGTPHYMAPELINCSGYDFAVDLWALGVTLYYMLFSRLPFAHSECDPRAVQEFIRRNNYHIPPELKMKVSRPAQQLVRSLLVKFPPHRLSAIEVCHHPFLMNRRSGSL